MNIRVLLKVIRRILKEIRFKLLFDILLRNRNISLIRWQIKNPKFKKSLGFIQISESLLSNKFLKLVFYDFYAYYFTIFPICGHFACTFKNICNSENIFFSIFCKVSNFCLLA